MRLQIILEISRSEVGRRFRFSLILPVIERFTSGWKRTQLYNRAYLPYGWKLMKTECATRAPGQCNTPSLIGSMNKLHLRFLTIAGQSHLVAMKQFLEVLEGKESIFNSSSLTPFPILTSLPQSSGGDPYISLGCFPGNTLRVHRTRPDTLIYHCINKKKMKVPMGPMSRIL